MTLIAIVGCLVVLDLAADRFGVDSRQAYPDDWARAAGPGGHGFRIETEGATR